jgi:hypothetical protein
MASDRGRRPLGVHGALQCNLIMALGSHDALRQRCPRSIRVGARSVAEQRLRMIANQCGCSGVRTQPPLDAPALVADEFTGEVAIEQLWIEWRVVVHGEVSGSGMRHAPAEKPHTAHHTHVNSARPELRPERFQASPQLILDTLLRDAEYARDLGIAQTAVPAHLHDERAA